MHVCVCVVWISHSATTVHVRCNHFYYEVMIQWFVPPFAAGSKIQTSILSPKIIVTFTSYIFQRWFWPLFFVKAFRSTVCLHYGCLTFWWMKPPVTHYYYQNAFELCTMFRAEEINNKVMEKETHRLQWRRGKTAIKCTALNYELEKHKALFSRFISSLYFSRGLFIYCY